MKALFAQIAGFLIVFYQDDTCLGGAMIICRGQSYYELKKEVPKHLSVEE